MLHSIFITTDSGVCIFEKHYIESKIDSQLISGFINALGSFASEALGAEMQSLRLQTGEQLSILRYFQGKTPIIGIIIADVRDNWKLTRRILLEILTDFSTIFHQELSSEKILDLRQFQEFSYTVDTILDGRISSRTNLKMLVGVLMGLVLLGVLLLALIPAFIKFSSTNIGDFGLGNINFDNGLDATEIRTLQSVILVVIGVAMGFGSVVFFIPTFISAYIAGNRKRGIWTALLLSMSIALILLIATPFIESFTDVNAILWYLAFSPFLIFIAIVCGIYGGRLKDQRKLYPLKEFEKDYI